MNKNILLTIGITILFLGITIAPSINFNVVKASKNNDLVEVTTQACGINGYGNTTVKLTRQQYQNLEQYLVDFQARLNQTKTKEEAVPIFKEAVMELNKYGLLPKGMSIEEAQKLVLGGYQNPRYSRFLNRMLNSVEKSSNDENYNCLIAGRTTNTVSIGPILTLIQIGANHGYNNLYYLIVFLQQHNNFFLLLLFGGLYMFFAITSIMTSEVGLGNFIDNFHPILLLSTIGLGMNTWLPYDGGVYPAVGWIYTNGTNGIIKWNGSLYGDLPVYYFLSLNWFIFFDFYPGIIGFSGIKIILPLLGSFYLGNAFEIKISTTPPWFPFEKS